MIIGSIVGILAILGAITLYRTYALYEEEKEFNVLKGTIPDFGYDIKMLSVVVDDKKETTIPARGLYKTNVDCTNGTRGEWDYNAWNLTLENVSSNAKCNITFTSNLSEEEYNKYIEAGVSLRRNTYRGKDITEYHNDGTLYTMIKNGTFDDIYVGDYIVANNVTWLVADIDNYLYTGYIDGGANGGSLTKHHLTIIPNVFLAVEPMNDTATTEGGYYNSKMKQVTLNPDVSNSVYNTHVKPAFGTHILSYNTALTNNVNNDAFSMAGGNFMGSANSWKWVESKIDLMSEINVYGATVYSSSAWDVGVDDHQYAIFRLKPELINSSINGDRYGYTLKNVVSPTRFGFVHNISRIPTYDVANSPRGVRPRFLIG